MKKKIAISLIVAFIVFGVITFILTKIFDNKYDVLSDYVNPKIKSTKEEIKSNTNKLNEIKENSYIINSCFYSVWRNNIYFN